MIINNTYQFIFIHIPKTAGCTVTDVLSKYTKICDQEIGGTALANSLVPYYLQRFGLGMHSTSTEIKEIIGDEMWMRYKKIAFVRNPYERAYSIYNFMQRRYQNENFDAYEPIAAFTTFYEFITSEYFQTHGPDNLFLPQVYWLLDEQRKIDIDYLDHVESLEDNLTKMLEVCGLPKIAESEQHILPTINRSVSSKSALYEELYAHPEIEKIIYRRYAEDFDLLGYNTKIQSEIREIHFTENSPNLDCLKQGWSTPEAWGVWSDGTRAELRLTITSYKKPITILTFDFIAFLCSKSDTLMGTLSINSVKVRDLCLSTQENYVLSIPVDKNLECEAKKQGYFSVIFEIHNPKKPIDIGLNSDSRNLGIGLKTIVINFSD